MNEHQRVPRIQSSNWEIQMDQNSSGIAKKDGGKGSWLCGRGLHPHLRPREGIPSSSSGMVLRAWEMARNDRPHQRQRVRQSAIESSGEQLYAQRPQSRHASHRQDSIRSQALIKVEREILLQREEYPRWIFPDSRRSFSRSVWLHERRRPSRAFSHSRQVGGYLGH